MKIHFIYPDLNTCYLPTVHHGLAQLASVLLANGDDVSLQHVRHNICRNDIYRVLDTEKPDMIGFTVMTNQLSYVKQWSEWIKEKFDIPIVCGGVHATLRPEELLNIPSIDMVCVGEGEKAIINNVFWMKNGSGIVARTPLALVDNLDTLPYPDYSLFDYKHVLLSRSGSFAVICSRGCPYNCYYCCNHALREKQKGLGKYFRYRSVGNVIAMLESYLIRYPAIQSFSFSDDIFGINGEWVLEFCREYSQSIALPFDCNLRVESVTSDLAQALKEANCVMVEMGIESGNAWLRENMLNRKMTNQQIMDAFDTVHSVGIKTRAYNMIGLPCETRDMAIETLELNKIVKPDELAVFYFYPFPGTKLYDICDTEGYLTDRKATNYISESVLNLPSFSIKELRGVYGQFVEYMVIKWARAYGTICCALAYCLLKILRLFTCGNEASVLRWMYLNSFILGRMK